VPGDRFDQALEWARARVELLTGGDIDDVVFPLDNWDALACYLHDPAGNIVELIAHHEVAHANSTGPFHASELIGLSELGLVGDTATMARRLSDQLGLEVWDGSVSEPPGVAFIGQKARTLIVVPPGRGWLPTRRPAEAHGLDVLLSGAQPGELDLERSRYRIRSREA
jgi:hypothetical protein